MPAMRNAFKDLGPYLEQSEIDLGNYFTETKLTLPGKILAVPEELDIMALAYNKNLFMRPGSRIDQHVDVGRFARRGDKLTRQTSDANRLTALLRQQHPGDCGAISSRRTAVSFLTPDKKQAAINTLNRKRPSSSRRPHPQAQGFPNGAGSLSLPVTSSPGEVPFMTGLVAMKFQGKLRTRRVA
jgi:hypothetical protein